MVHFSVIALALVASTVNAAPLERRIAQVISDSTTLWQNACVHTLFLNLSSLYLIYLFLDLACCRWW